MCREGVKFYFSPDILYTKSMKPSPLIFVVLGLFLLGGLFLLFKPQNKPQTTQTTNVSSTPEKKIKTFQLVVKNRKLVSGDSVLKVTQDDDVVIKITVDEDEELHLHGYDKSMDLEKGKQGTLSFVAKVTGRFPFELEKSKTELGALEVQPK